MAALLRAGGILDMVLDTIQSQQQGQLEFTLVSLHSEGIEEQALTA